MRKADYMNEIILTALNELLILVKELNRKLDRIQAELNRQKENK